MVFLCFTGKICMMKVAGSLNTLLSSFNQCYFYSSFSFLSSCICLVIVVYKILIILVLFHIFPEYSAFTFPVLHFRIFHILYLVSFMILVLLQTVTGTRLNNLCCTLLLLGKETFTTYLTFFTPLFQPSL